jgi:hypothetical protein
MLFLDDSYYYGAYVLGDHVPVSMVCTSTAGVPSAPTAAPTMSIYTDDGTLVLSRSIPPLLRYTQTGLFHYDQPLNSSFSTGRYVVRFDYVVSGSNRAALGCFVVRAGGHTSGQHIAMAYIDRPDQNDWIVTQTDQGSVKIHRGPSL